MMNPGSILKVEQTRFADGLDIEGERNRGSRMTPKLLAWATEKTQLTLPGMEDAEGRTRRFLSSILHRRCLLVFHVKVLCGQLDV